MDFPRLLQFSFCVLLNLAIFITMAASRSDLETITIYDALKDYGLPVGLLPKGVSEFKIDENGNFQVHLDQACNAKFESELHYDRIIFGTLSYGRISNLSGIEAQELFLWFKVISIHVDVPRSGLIYFDVGVVVKQCSQSLFESPPDCVALLSLDPQVVMSIYKQQIGMLRHQVPHDEIGSADM